MTTSPDEFIDHVKARAQLSSDRQLALEIEIAPQNVFRWRKGHNLPTDENMFKLAELADIPREEALLMLNVWRATGEAKSLYARMLEKSRSIAALFLCAFSLVWGSLPNIQGNQAHAETVRAEVSHNMRANIIHYAPGRCFQNCCVLSVRIH